MTELKKFFASLAKDESGTTAVEYGLMVGLVTVALVAAVGGLSGAIEGALGAAAAAIGG